MSSRFVSDNRTLLLLMRRGAHRTRGKTRQVDATSTNDALAVAKSVSSLVSTMIDNEWRQSSSNGNKSSNIRWCYWLLLCLPACFVAAVCAFTPSKSNRRSGCLIDERMVVVRARSIHAVVSLGRRMVTSFKTNGTIASRPRQRNPSIHLSILSPSSLLRLSVNESHFRVEVERAHPHHHHLCKNTRLECVDARSKPVMLFVITMPPEFCRRNTRTRMIAITLTARVRCARTRTHR